MGLLPWVVGDIANNIRESIKKSRIKIRHDCLSSFRMDLMKVGINRGPGISLIYIPRLFHVRVDPQSPSLSTTADSICDLLCGDVLLLLRGLLQEIALECISWYVAGGAVSNSTRHDAHGCDVEVLKVFPLGFLRLWQLLLPLRFRFLEVLRNLDRLGHSYTCCWRDLTCIKYWHLGMNGLWIAIKMYIPTCGFMSIRVIPHNWNLFCCIQ